MNCEHAIELMQRYVDNDLSEQETLVLNAHLRDCPPCALAFERLQALHEQLLQLPKIKPKYSIVDSILPKLLEMDVQSLEKEREESAALDADEPRRPKPEQVRTRRSFGYVSWKLTGAVAAAACAILFFIWNKGESPQQNKLATEAALLKVADKASTPSANAPVATMQSEAPKVMPTPTPTPIGAPEANAGMKESIEQTPIPELKKTEVTVLQSKINSFGDSSDAADAKIDLATPAPSPAASPVFDTKGDETVKDIAVPSPDPGMVGGGNGITSIVPEGSQKVKPEDLNKNKRVANDHYVAEVKDHKLMISSVATNAVVFTSLLQWTDLESVIPVSWTPEGKFYYEVVGNGEFRAYLIDVRSRTELQIK